MKAEIKELIKVLDDTADNLEDLSLKQSNQDKEDSLDGAAQSLRDAIQDLEDYLE